MSFEKDISSILNALAKICKSRKLAGVKFPNFLNPRMSSRMPTPTFVTSSFARSACNSFGNPHLFKRNSYTRLSVANWSKPTWCVTPFLNAGFVSVSKPM